MNSKEMQDQMIKNYQQDEQMMILVFAQWCVNHDLNPEEVYRNAYPHQEKNQALQNGIDLTVSKEEAGEISYDTVIGVLSLFGNDDLAIAVTEEHEKMKKNRKRP